MPAATKRSKGEQTKGTILTAAIQRFGSDGFRATSVTDVARDADVGGTVPYAYFPNKEALFLAAVDHDAAALISEGLAIFLRGTRGAWREDLALALIASVDDHPLARRLLAGLEPEITPRVLEIPALAELRRVCADRLRLDQIDGTVRVDIDPEPMANGLVAILLSLLMSVVQLGREATLGYQNDVARVFSAALEPIAEP